MRLRLLLALAVLALPLASFQAAAQGAPTMTITLTGPTTGTVNAGQQHSAAFTLIVEASGFQCTQPGTIDIGIALTNAGGAPAGVTPSVDPANFSITVDPGVYGQPVPGLPVPIPGTEPVNESTTVTLRIATTAIASGTYPAAISATHAAGPAGMGCIGDLPAATFTANHQLTIVGSGGNGTGGSGGGGSGGSGGNGTGGNGTGGSGGEQPPANRGLPGFEPLVAFGALAIAVAARRRRD